MIRIVIQNTVARSEAPSSFLLKKWAKTVVLANTDHAELTIRIVNSPEMKDLNTRYRKKEKTTNVLSFPFDMPDDIDEMPILGDIVICADVVNSEAAAQHKTKDAHWAHMVVHGTLHLLGYDHETVAEANIMEPKEIVFLQQLGFSNPYQSKGE